ncbi:EamA family transporter [Phenylobacterium sp. J426]|uniref:EamA family transporter n=1 Tax=Phenylobacterium sp. J426 TaxID=2898439 RepID=UPI002151F772|nr:EamA family transporter [Phenylobacterium sp. J426]MCR5876442.1 EamA family transporter [Phenylobacterium sp. J426]
MIHQPRGQAAGPMLLVLAGLLSQNLGAAFAKQLFPLVGPLGATALRVSLAALLLGLVWRPWRTRRTPSQWRGLALYGLSLGLMNILIYGAFARIPIGLAVAIEVTGPLAVVLVRSRQVVDLVFAGLAAAGLLLLLPIVSPAGVDPIGLASAGGAAVTWAAYILLGAGVAGDGRSGETVALGLAVAALVAAPIGVLQAGVMLLQPAVLVAGLGLAILSSAAPYSLEMFALRRLSPKVFAQLVASAPAVAALVGWVTLGERLTLIQWAAIGLITVAIAGASAVDRPRGQSGEGS